MRIVIDIDHHGTVTTRIEPPDAPLGPTEAVPSTPPPEVLRAAESLGAMSAGPAPARVAEPRLAYAAERTSLLETLAAAPADGDAGEAREAPIAASRGPRKAAGAKKRPVAKSARKKRARARKKAR